MKRCVLHKTILAVVACAFIVTGCMKIVKDEEVRKAAEPAQVTQPEEEKPAESKEGEAVILEERVEEEEIAVKEKAEAVSPGDEMVGFADERGRLLTVYFDFDRFTIRDDMKPVLEKNAKWLEKNPSAMIIVEGHCDERGTNEYNIALGERRAQSIKDYLVNYGISARRISTISYGEERPAHPESSEEAWAKNRRGELVIKK